MPKFWPRGLWSIAGDSFLDTSEPSLAIDLNQVNNGSLVLALAIFASKKP